MSDNTITISKSEYQSLLNAQKHMNFMANNPLGNDKDEVLKLIGEKFLVDTPYNIYGREEWFDEVRERAAEIMSEYDRGYDWADAMDEAIDDILFKCDLTNRIYCGEATCMRGQGHIHNVDEEAWDDYAFDATSTGFWKEYSDGRLCEFELAGGGSHAWGLIYDPDKDEWVKWSISGHHSKVKLKEAPYYYVNDEDDCRSILFEGNYCLPLNINASRMDKMFMKTYEPRK